MESDIMLWILTKETQQQKQKTKRQKGSPFEKKNLTSTYLEWDAAICLEASPRRLKWKSQETISTESVWVPHPSSTWDNHTMLSFPVPLL